MLHTTPLPSDPELAGSAAPVWDRGSGSYVESAHVPDGRRSLLPGVPRPDGPQVQRVWRVRLLFHRLREARRAHVDGAARLRRAQKGHARTREPGRIGDPLRDASADAGHGSRAAGRVPVRDAFPADVGDSLPRRQALPAPRARGVAIDRLREDGLWHVGCACQRIRKPLRGLPAPQLPAGETQPGGSNGHHQRGRPCARAARRRGPPAGGPRRGEHADRPFAADPLRRHLRSARQPQVDDQGYQAALGTDSFPHQTGPPLQDALPSRRPRSHVAAPPARPH